MVSHAPATIKKQQDSPRCVVEFKALDACSLSLDHDLIRLNVRNKLASSIPYRKCENLCGMAVGLSMECQTK